MKITNWPNNLGFNVGAYAEVWKLAEPSPYHGLFSFGVRVFSRKRIALKYMKFSIRRQDPSHAELIQMVQDCRRFGNKIQ